MSSLASAYRRRFVVLVFAATFAAFLLLLAPVGAKAPPAAPPVTAAAAVDGRALPGVEVPELRTRESRSYRRDDGTIVARVWAGAVNFRDGDRWSAIDNRVVRTTAEQFENRANAYRLRLPRRLESAPVSYSRGNGEISFSLRGAAGALEASGAVARFTDALPGVTLEYSLENEVVKESLVLTGSYAPTEFTFDLDPGAGVTPRENAEGGIDFVRDGGAVAFSFAAPFMFDERYARDGDPRGFSDAVTMRLREEGDGYAITLRADRAWVRSPDRVGAVTIDPTTIYATGDCYIVDGAAANTNHCSTPPTLLPIGLHNGQRHRALMRFDARAAIPENSEVLEGELWLYTDNTTTLNAVTLDVHELERDWTSATSWNRWSASSNWTTPGGDFRAQEEGSRVTGTSGAAGWRTWYFHQLVEDWIDGDKPQRGVLVKQRGETTANLIRVRGRGHSSSSYWPQVDVTYREPTGSLSKYSFIGRERLTDRSSLQVNAASGNLMVQDNDVQLAGTGMGLNINRVYNSLYWHQNSMGNWWINTGRDVFLQDRGDGSWSYHAPSGWHTRFDPDRSTPDPNDFVEAKHLRMQLEKNPSTGGFKLKHLKSDIEFNFNAQGYLTSQQDRNGNKLTHSYDTGCGATPDFSCRWLRVSDTTNRTTTMTHDGIGQITKVTDPIGRVHSYVIGSDRILDSYTAPDGRITRYSHDSAGLLKQITTPGGRIATFTYDAQRRVTSVTWGGHITSYAYGGAGTRCNDARNTVVTDARGNATTYCWDKQSRVDKVFDALGRKRSAQYDPASNVTQAQGVAGGTAATPYGTTFGYDSGGNSNLESIEQPGESSGSGAKHSFTYGTGNDTHRMSGSTDSTGNKKNFNYDGSGNLRGTSAQTTTGGTESLAKFDYYQAAAADSARCTSVPAAFTGPKGTLRCSRDGNNHETHYNYNATGDLITIKPPGPLGEITYTYDGVSRTVSMTDGKNQRRVFTYDARDRVTRVDFHRADATLEATVSFGYDADGNLTSRTDAEGTTTYEYDSRNLRTRETIPGAISTSYAYDPVKSLASTTTPDGTTSYIYNQVNLLTELVDPNLGRTTYAYDDDNSRTRTTFPGAVNEARTHTKSERVKTLKVTKPDGAAIVDLTYDYVNGARETESVHKVTDAVRNTTTTFEYDHLGRLTARRTSGAVTENYTYQYDSNSNRLLSTNENGDTTSYNYNAANEMTSAGGVTYQYDANGNTTSSSNGWQFTYNALNQTTSIKAPGQATTHPIKYRGIGQAEMNDRNGAAFHYSMLGLARKAGEAYVREPGGALHSQTVGGVRAYYLMDHHPNSVMALVDGAGNSLATYRYDPFGVDKGSTGSHTNSLRFAGGEYSPELKLYKFGERFYDPNLGRWTQQDPLNQAYDPREANRYVYVGADPINLIDPSGLECYGLNVKVGLGFDFGYCTDEGSVEIGVGVGIGIFVTEQEETDAIQTDGGCIVTYCEGSADYGSYPLDTSGLGLGYGMSWQVAEF